MNQLSILDGDGHQTIINILAWMQTNAREGIHARLSEFHEKSKEDIMAWCKKVDRIATTNNWRVGRIYTIVAAYLKGAATDYYKEESENMTDWSGENVANNLKDLLIA